ncbi:TetR/AcrR family transcriptional regulator [Nocardiopsis sp. B62]|uniref:TetR/AcrR family transcriptional regulator n=1 Tax=Nocardiopsis sp. B62 TaxID=2824874 RepID=UPI001B379136|nr:TetR/AcrR family transcriptional regulator [Nocardiopsis sp. B62]MBQ1084029.1 TetR/AcrR family transcriptional regulator [Nocardiopsis sp. B62]
MPRAGLTPVVVTAEAASLVDERGFDSLSLAALAKRLGVATPSLYKHVDGLDGLRREVSLLAVGELAERLRSAATGRSGPDALRALFDAHRRYALEYPGRYVSIQRAPAPTDTEARATFARPVEVIAAVLRGFAIPERQMVHTIRALRSAVHGFVDLETHGGFGLPEDVDESYAVLVEGFVRALDNWPGRDEGAREI